MVGLLKAVAQEHPAALVKCVDFAEPTAAGDVAEALVDETLFDRGAVEIGRRGALRTTLALVEQPAGERSAARTLGPASVVVVTGAAGSIVSAITRDLAAASGGTFHLLDLTPELREHFGVPGKDGGVMVSKVEPDSPAAKAGIRVGDIVTGLGPKKVESGWDLRRRVRELKDGEAVTQEVVRDRRVKTIQATAVQRERNIVDLRELSIAGDIIIQIDQERLQKQIQESMKHFNSPDFQARLERPELERGYDVKPTLADCCHARPGH